MKNCIIVMDNAAYHVKKPEGKPQGGWKKQRLQEECMWYGLQFDEKETKPIFWDRLKKNIDECVVPMVVTMAQDAGHDILFTPPHYSDLQPIETIWVIVKGEVGCQYTTTTTFKIVLDRLNKAFNSLTPKTVAGCVNKSNRNLDEFRQNICDVDNLEESDDRSDGGSLSTLSDDQMSD